MRRSDCNSQNVASHAAKPSAPRVRRSPFNREYQRRAARVALARVGVELIRDQTGTFYRPAKRPSPVLPQPPRDTRQLTLDFSDPEKPLADLFPEAYE